MLIVVGSRFSEFPFITKTKYKFYCEEDPNNFLYNEMCGHKFLLDHIDDLMTEPYLGLEHYRRAFSLTDPEIREILDKEEVIVKAEHGPYGELSNRDVLGGCSRYGINYLPLADKWLSRWPELREQADRKTHFGCSMLIAKPERYREMMEDEFSYIDRMLQDDGLTRASIGYFCETILTPHIIRKHNTAIHVAPVEVAA